MVELSTASTIRLRLLLSPSLNQKWVWECQSVVFPRTHPFFPNSISANERQNFEWRVKSRIKIELLFPTSSESETADYCSVVVVVEILSHITLIPVSEATAGGKVINQVGKRTLAFPVVFHLKQQCFCFWLILSRSCFSWKGFPLKTTLPGFSLELRDSTRTRKPTIVESY